MSQKNRRQAPRNRKPHDWDLSDEIVRAAFQSPVEENHRERVLKLISSRAEELAKQIRTIANKRHAERNSSKKTEGIRREIREHVHANGIPRAAYMCVEACQSLGIHLPPALLEVLALLLAENFELPARRADNRQRAIRVAVALGAEGPTSRRQIRKVLNEGLEEDDPCYVPESTLRSWMSGAGRESWGRDVAEEVARIEGKPQPRFRVGPTRWG